MNIIADSLPKSFQLNNVIRTRDAMGKLSIPVSSPNLVYIRLKNVQGVPPSQDGRGYSLNKLQALDNLISRLRRIKENRTTVYKEIQAEMGENSRLEQMRNQHPIQDRNTSAELDSLIQKFAQSLNYSQKNLSLFSPGEPVEKGILFDLTA